MKPLSAPSGEGAGKAIGLGQPEHVRIRFAACELDWLVDALRQRRNEITARVSRARLRSDAQAAKAWVDTLVAFDAVDRCDDE